jgi:hypothetical protein
MFLSIPFCFVYINNIVKNEMYIRASRNGTFDLLNNLNVGPI